MLQHAGLDDALLGPRLARLLAASSPLPAREMVARGLAPLAGAEPWLALYQLWVRGGPTLAEQASRTAGELPVAAVMTGLADPHLPAVVLDFMARRRIHSPETLRLLVHHPKIHDSTLGALARCAPEMVCSAIAKNQRRWLACPAIAEQLVHNPCCDRATAHAVLELGAREAIAGLAELRRRALDGAALQDSPEQHARATAWMLRSGPGDSFPELDHFLEPARPAGPRPGAAGEPGGLGPHTGLGLSLRPGSLAQRSPRSEPEDALDDLPLPGAPGGPGRLSFRSGAANDRQVPGRLSLRPGHSDNRDDPPLPGSTDAPVRLSLRPGSNDAPRRVLGELGRLGDLGRVESLDDLDDLDLPLGDDWDDDPGEADPPAPRGAVPLPELALPPARPLAPRQLELPRAAASPPRDAGAPVRSMSPATAKPPTRYAAQVQLVLDPTTPLPLAMSLLHRLRAADLRRVATATRLAPALVAAARRRTGAP